MKTPKAGRRLTESEVDHFAREILADVAESEIAYATQARPQVAKLNYWTAERVIRNINRRLKSLGVPPKSMRSQSARIIARIAEIRQQDIA